MCEENYLFKKGDIVQICLKGSKHDGEYATVAFDVIGSFRRETQVAIKFNPRLYPMNQYDKLFWQSNLKLISEVKQMRLTGFKHVAVIEYANRDLFYALYDDDIISGDNVLVTGQLQNKFHTVKDVLSLEEFVEKNINNIVITEEVKCSFDLSKYNERVVNREKAEKLRKDMDAKIAAMDELNKYVMYAEKNPDLAKMLEEYRELIG